MQIKLSRINKLGELEDITSVCLIEPLGDFAKDPDGEITQIKLINFSEYKGYSDPQLGPIVDRQIERVREVKKRIESGLSKDP